MKRVLIVLSDEQYKVLKQSPNMSDTVRKALDIYNEHITTDTVQGLRQSYAVLLKSFDERFAVYDLAFERMDKLIGVLEARM